jgi:hypothetical protein
MGDHPHPRGYPHTSAQRLGIRRAVCVTCRRPGDDVDRTGSQRRGRPLGVPLRGAHQDRRRNAGHDPFDDLDRRHSRQVEVEHDR